MSSELTFCLNLTIPLVGYPWHSSPSVGEEFRRVHLHQRAAGRDGDEGQPNLIQTLLYESYRPQLVLGGIGDDTDRGSCLSSWSKEKLEKYSEVYRVIRLFPVGGGVVTFHVLLENLESIEAFLEELFDFEAKPTSSKESPSIRKDLFNSYNRARCKVESAAAGSGADGSGSPSVLTLGSVDDFPVFPTLVIEGFDIRRLERHKFEDVLKLGTFGGDRGDEAENGGDGSEVEKSDLETIDASGGEALAYWSLAAKLLRLASRVLHGATNGREEMNWPSVVNHFAGFDARAQWEELTLESLNFSLDSRITLLIGRRGGIFGAESFGKQEVGKQEDGPAKYVVGAAVNLVEIMWSRLFLLVWLNNELDNLVSSLTTAGEEEVADDGENKERIARQRKVYTSLFDTRRSLFSLLKDPACFLFDGGSVTDMADFLLEKFWIRRQEDLIRGKISLLDELLASHQVLEVWRNADRSAS